MQVSKEILNSGPQTRNSKTTTIIIIIIITLIFILYNVISVTGCLNDSCCHGCDRDWFVCDVTNERKANSDSLRVLFFIRRSLLQVDTPSHMLITTQCWQLYTPV
jgi:hypothetical protein